MSIMLNHTRYSSGRKPPRLVDPSLSLLLLLAACGGGGGGGGGRKRVNIASDQIGLESLLMHDNAGPEALSADRLIEVNENFKDVVSRLGFTPAPVDWAMTTNANQDRVFIHIQNQGNNAGSQIEVRLAGWDSALFKFVRDGQFFGIAFRDPPDARNPRDKDRDSDYKFELRFFSQDRKNDYEYDFILYRVRVTDENGVHLQQMSSDPVVSVLSSPSKREGVQDVQILEGDGTAVLGEFGTVTMRYFFIDSSIRASTNEGTEQIRSMVFRSLDVIDDGSTLVMTSEMSNGEIVTTHFSLVADTWHGSANSRSGDFTNFMFTTDGSFWSLRFREPPDYEAPRDGRDQTPQDNIYYLGISMNVLGEEWNAYNVPNARRLKITVRNDPSDDAAASSAAGGRHLESGIYDETGLISDGGTLDVSAPDII